MNQTTLRKSKKSQLGKLTMNDHLYQTFCYIFFGLFAFLCAWPFYYILTVSISDNDLVRRGILLLYPQGIQFRNYINAFALPGFGRSWQITLTRTALGTFITVLTSAWMGYSFSKREFWLRGFWYKFVILTMYFSPGLIPVYLNYRMLGLLDTFWIYIIGFVGAFNIILCKTFIENLPASLEESAKIDGAKYLKIFFLIVLPLSKPILATISVFTAVGHWNAYMDTVLFIRNRDLYTLQYTLFLYLNQATALARAMSQAGGVEGMAGIDLSRIVTATSIRMTIAMMVTIPVLFVYPFFQRFFIRGIMIGAIKG